MRKAGRGAEGKVQREQEESLGGLQRELSRTGRAVYSCIEAEGVPRWLVLSPRPKDSMPSLNLVLLCPCAPMSVSYQEGMSAAGDLKHVLSLQHLV